MKYYVYCRGKNVDYKWDPAPEYVLQNYLGDNGFVVFRHDTGDYDVYLVSEPSEAVDFRGRRISIGVLVTGCAPAKAKGIAKWALDNWNAYGRQFAEFVADLGSDDWKPDSAKLGNFFERIPELPATGREFGQRTVNGNTAETRRALAADLAACDFTPRAGFKLVADGGLMTGENLRKIKESVQRYLTGGGNLEVIRDDAPEPHPQGGAGKSDIKAAPAGKPCAEPVQSAGKSRLLALAVALIALAWGCVSYNNLKDDNKSLKTKLEKYEDSVNGINNIIQSKNNEFTQLTNDITSKTNELNKLQNAIKSATEQRDEAENLMQIAKRVTENLKIEKTDLENKIKEERRKGVIDAIKMIESEFKTITEENPYDQKYKVELLRYYGRIMKLCDNWEKPPVKEADNDPNQ